MPKKCQHLIFGLLKVKHFTKSRYSEILRLKTELGDDKNYKYIWAFIAPFKIKKKENPNHLIKIKYNRIRKNRR